MRFVPTSTAHASPSGVAIRHCFIPGGVTDNAIGAGAFRWSVTSAPAATWRRYRPKFLLEFGHFSTRVLKVHPVPNRLSFATALLGVHSCRCTLASTLLSERFFRLQLPQEGGQAVLEDIDKELAKRVREALKDSSALRLKRLAAAPKLPEAIQVVSKVYRRNPDVIAEVLNRADYRCKLLVECIIIGAEVLLVLF